MRLVHVVNVADVAKMTRIGGALVWRSFALALALAGAACVQDTAEQPGAVGGPSELGVSIALSATPDQLPLDGAAQALIGMVARDQTGAPIPNLRLALQISTSQGLVDFGQLSAREVMTGADGSAAATYTVPLGSTNPIGSADTGQVVTIRVTPIGNNFANAVARTVTIRLVPSGTVIPPFTAIAAFGVAPAAPVVFDTILFTTACATPASTDCVTDPNGLVISYAWDFGDGSTAGGPTVSHAYDIPGTYLVTLTIRDGYNRFTQTTRSITVAAGTAPTAVMTRSPTSASVNDAVFFSASQSTAAPGRTIVSYEWNFGDGTGAFGVTRSHVYRSAGSYTATLEVIDDKGQNGFTQQTFSVGEVALVASFVFSPEDPAPGDTVHFDAQSSEPGPGRSIVLYRWNFGDGNIVEAGPTISHPYPDAGTYNVQLTVVSDLGESNTATNAVTVEP